MIFICKFETTMPRMFMPTPNSHETMTRPIALGIAKQLRRALELPNETPIFYPGDIGIDAQPGSRINQPNNDPVKFQFEDRISIEINEKPNDEYILQTTVHQKDALPYFLDPKIGIELKPVYSHTTLEFSIVLRARSRDRAKRIRDQILAHRAMGRESHLHEVDYSYCVPDLGMALLKQVHNLREAQAGYGEDFSTWVRNHITDRATNLTNQSGKRFALAIAEHQIEILGWFDFPAVPDSLEKDHDAGTWNWNINYVTNYDKVIGTSARWPLVVHNQFMPRPWHSTPVASGRMVDPSRRSSRAGQFKNAIRTATGNYLHKDYGYHRTIGGYIYPAIDEWEPEEVKKDTSTVCIALMQVDLNDPYNIGQIGDFGEFKLVDDFIAYMKHDWKELATYKNSVIHVSLFEDGIELDDELLEIDEDLNVRKKGKPMDPRKTYRLRVSLLNELGGIHGKAKTKLLDGSKESRLILKTILTKTTGKLSMPSTIYSSLPYMPIASSIIWNGIVPILPGKTKEEKLEDWIKDWKFNWIKDWEDLHKNDNPKPLTPDPPDPPLPYPTFEDDPIPDYIFKQSIIEVNATKGVYYSGQEYILPYAGQFLVVLRREPGAP